MFRFSPMMARIPVFAPEDGTGAAPPATPPAAEPPAAAPNAAAKWFAGERFNADEQRFLESKGWNVDDPADAATKLLKSYRAAEQKLGKGPDALIDKPAKGQTFTEWAKGNAAALGLPDSIDAYKVEPPKDFPKDIAWDSALDEKAREMAFSAGIPPELHQKYVGLFAEHMASIGAGIDQSRAAATTELRGALTREWGAQAETRINRARQTIQHFATEAGLTEDGMTNALAGLFDAGGDPFVMKLFDAIGASMGEDKAVNIAKGGAALGMTPAEATAQLAAMGQPGGDLYEALEAQRDGKTGWQDKLSAATAKRNAMAAIAAGGK